MRLFIEPLETLLFRTGLPFDAGEGNLATSLFPPTPETLQGAIRAMIATTKFPNDSMAKAFSNPALTNLIGDRSNYGRFRITQIGLGRYETKNPETIELLLPPPSHLLQNEDEKLVLLTPRPAKEMMDAVTELPDGITHVLTPNETNSAQSKLKPVSGWLPLESLQKVLHPDVDLESLAVVKNGEIYEQESRLGIGIDSGTKRTRDGFLYQQRVIRMRECCGFVIDISLSSKEDPGKLIADNIVKEELFPHCSEGRMTIGGEQRAARFRIVKPDTTENDKSSRSGKLVYLATPAYFSTAWKPSEKFSRIAHPIAASVARPEAIGGWKLNAGDAKGDQKALNFCVPAGSVYFYEQPVSLTQPLTEYGEQIGYGITYIGDWKA